MDKKGVEITLNTVIVGILVVLVLLVVTTFFLGGTAGLTRTVRDIFYGTTAGITEVIAIQTCNTRCEQAEILPESRWLDSAFCKVTFDVDQNNNGELEEKEKGLNCVALGVNCAAINDCKAKAEKVEEPTTTEPETATG